MPSYLVDGEKFRTWGGYETHRGRMFLPLPDDWAQRLHLAGVLKQYNSYGRHTTLHERLAESKYLLPALRCPACTEGVPKDATLYFGPCTFDGFSVTAIRDALAEYDAAASTEADHGPHT